MALTKLNIWNLALSHIGIRTTILTDTEDSTEREVVDLHYTGLVEEAISRRPWSFSSTEADLVDATTPPTNWAYRYTYPTDCIKPQYIVGDGKASGNHPVQFKVMKFGSTSPFDHVILSDRVNAVLVYTFRGADDESNWPIMFANALTHGLAAGIAVALTKSLKIAAFQMALFERQMVEAFQFDGGFQDAVRNRADVTEETAHSGRFVE